MNLFTIENLLRSIYLNILSQQLNTSNPFLASIKNTSEDVWGKEIRKTISNQSMQIVSELKSLYAE